MGSWALPYGRPRRIRPPKWFRLWTAPDTHIPGAADMHDWSSLWGMGTNGHVVPERHPRGGPPAPHPACTLAPQGSGTQNWVALVQGHVRAGSGLRPPWRSGSKCVWESPREGSWGSSAGSRRGDHGHRGAIRPSVRVPRKRACKPVPNRLGGGPGWAAGPPGLGAQPVGACRP